MNSVLNVRPFRGERETGCKWVLFIPPTYASLRGRVFPAAFLELRITASSAAQKLLLVDVGALVINDGAGKLAARH